MESVRNRRRQVNGQTMLAEAMAQEQLTEKSVIDYHEEGYKVSSFLDRILGYRRPSTIADVGFWQSDPKAAKKHWPSCCRCKKATSWAFSKR